jgi:lipopolysaccharide transport system permease protein
MPGTTSIDAPRAKARAVEEVVIRPPGAFAHINLLELYRYRGTLWRKAKQRVRIQYDEMLLGLFWAVARPLIMVLVFWAFRGLAKAKMGVSIPYPLYVYSGLVVWFYFTEAAMGVAMSLQRDAALIQKVYYPRLVSPLSYLVAATYNLALAAIPLAAMMCISGEYPGWRILLLPLVLGQLMLMTLGVGLVFSSLILISRDWERSLGFVLYVGFWVSPVIYAVGLIPSAHQIFYLSNPMIGTLLAMRSALFSHFELPWGSWAYSLLFSAVITGLGLLLFQRSERTLADKL